MPKPQFEELDYRPTAIGDVSLRRRTVLSLDNQEVFEITLGDAFLMSSLFTVVEEELSRLGLAAVKNEGQPMDVVVGGLGLGYTAVAALENPEVESLRVIDYLKPVIEWHETELVPLGKQLNADPRCRYVHGDFFDLALNGFDPENPEQKFHALAKMSQQIHSGGVFGLWSDDPPEEGFMKSLEQCFDHCSSHVVEFFNPLQNITSASTVYVAVKS